ncbi:MAG: HAD family phosphatase [Eubacteriales bacterium]|nr:HAD family phosphatase [Eubacteriales bacterium]
MIKNIVFDMGNVIIRFDPELFMIRLGLAEEDRKLLKRELFVSLEWSRMDRGSLTDEEAAEIVCRRVPERLHDAVRRLVGMWDRPILPVDGMYELVEELKGMGYGIYLLSNASFRQHDYWPRVPASKFFDGTLISADVKLVKPQPEIYRLLCDKFSLVPEECVFIDDSTSNAEGAYFCGINALVFHGDAHEMRLKLNELGVKVKC